MTSEMNKVSPTVLVALDGSTASSTALPVARVVARQLGTKLEVLYVLGPGEVVPTLAELIPDYQRSEPGVQVRIAQGDPAAAILHLIEDPKVTLVVLTTHGREIEPAHRLGHVAEAVIARSIQPVLLVRPEAAVRDEALASEIRHLLVPLDGSPTTSEVLVSAIALADQLGANIDLLYVANKRPPVSVAEAGSFHAPRYIDQPQHEWPAWANEVVAHLRACCGEIPAGVVARVFLSTGDIGDAIARFAREHHEDAVVLVRRSQLEAGRALILRAVLEQTPCPVLLLGKGDETSDVNDWLHRRHGTAVR